MCFISIEEYVLTALEIDNLSYLWRGEMVSWKLAWGKGKHSITFSCIVFHVFYFYNVSAVKKNQKELVNKYFPGDSVIKNPPTKQEVWFDPQVGKIPWRRKWQITPVFLPWKSHGQRSLVGYSPWVGKSWTWYSD